MDVELVSKAEGVGAGFSLQGLLAARDRAWQLLHSVRAEIRPGMTEAEAIEIYQDHLLKSGAEKQWHPPKLRFGVNSLRAFREPSAPDVRLKSEDIFFIDIGPIYEGYEGDVGQTFVIGNNAAQLRVKAECEKIFAEIRDLFCRQNLSGQALYGRAEALAQQQGYQLVGEGAQGHRIGDFPHAVHYRGSLRHYQQNPSAGRWILEIQLRDLANEVGAFFEDLV
jgi:Xaa-Pro aminopeptidase